MYSYNSVKTALRACSRAARDQNTPYILENLEKVQTRAGNEIKVQELIRQAKIDHLYHHQNHWTTSSSSYLDDFLQETHSEAICVDIGYVRKSVLAMTRKKGWI